MRPNKREFYVTFNINNDSTYKVRSSNILLKFQLNRGIYFLIEIKGSLNFYTKQTNSKQ